MNKKLRVTIHENQTGSFTFNEIGERTKKLYQGTFIVKSMLNPIEELAVMRELKDILGPHWASCTDAEYNIAYSLCELKYRIINAPPFWNNAPAGNFPGGGLMDKNIILKVLDYATEVYRVQAKLLKEEGKKTLKKLEDSLQKYDQDALKEGTGDESE
jgi:hypothetical protein